MAGLVYRIIPPAAAVMTITIAVIVSSDPGMAMMVFLPVMVMTMAVPVMSAFLVTVLMGVPTVVPVLAAIVIGKRGTAESVSCRRENQYAEHSFQ